MTWLAVTGPYYEDGTMPLDRPAWIWLLPLMDGLLALVALRGMTVPGPHRHICQLLALGFLVLGVAHVVSGWSAYDGELRPGSASATTLMIGPLLVGLAAT